MFFLRNFQDIIKPMYQPTTTFPSNTATKSPKTCFKIKTNASAFLCLSLHKLQQKQVIKVHFGTWMELKCTVRAWNYWLMLNNTFFVWTTHNSLKGFIKGFYLMCVVLQNMLTSESVKVKTKKNVWVTKMYAALIKSYFVCLILGKHWCIHYRK